MLLVTRLISSFFVALAVCSGAVVQNDLPTPLFDGRASASAYTDLGSEAATCTPTNVTFVEDPPSSGLYAAEFDGASGKISCGTGLDGLGGGPATFSVYIRPTSVGENSAGFVYSKGTDASNRAWQLLLDSDAGTFCLGSTAGDCYQFGVSNQANQIRGHETEQNTVVYSGEYIAIVFTVSCTSTSVQSCDATTAYINGFEVSRNNGTVTGPIRTADGSDTFMLGNRPADDRTFAGRIKRAVVFGVTMNKFQVEASYYRTLAADTPDVAADFSLLPCSEANAAYWAAAGYETSPFDLTADTATIGGFCDPFGTGERPTERTETAQ